MEQSKKIVAEDTKAKTVGEWRVPSRSASGVFHTVALLKTGEFTCDCLAFFYSGSGECRHIEMVKSQCYEEGKN